MKKKIDTHETWDKVSKSLNDTINLVPRAIKETYTFKGRKSPEILKKVILALTNEDAYILDPFLGSGMTLIAAQGAKRKFFGIELDNYTYSVNKTLFEIVDSNKLEAYFKQIKDSVEDKVLYLYETECDGEKNYIKKVLFDLKNGKDGYFSPEDNREIKDGCNVILMKKTIKGNTSKKFDELDWKKIQEVELMDASAFPNETYYENSRINITKSTGADKYGEIFSHRNKVALLMIQEEISKLPVSEEKNFLQHVLVASLSLARIAMYGSSTDILYHVVREKAQDMNVWFLFESRYKKFVKFQNGYKKFLTDCFEDGNECKVINADYYEYLKNNKDLIFDAVVTDFPYTDQVPYLERNQMFRIWLNNFADKKEYFGLTKKMLDSEMVVTNAVARKEKNLERYYQDIDKMFRTFSEHLKVGSPVVIFTKLGKMKYFNVFARIVDYARKNGFEYTFRIGVEKSDPTLRKQSAYKNTLINEVIIVFEKLPESKRYLYIGDENYETKLVDDVYRALKKVRDVSYTLTTAIANAKTDLAKKGIHFDEKLQNLLVNVIKNNFYVDGQDIQLNKTRLYLDQEDEDTLFKKLYDLVPFYVEKLLKKNGKFVLEDLYVELIDELSDGNNRTLYSLLNDDDNIEEINRLVKDKTDKSSDDKYYIKKQLPKDFNKDAIDVATIDAYEFENLCKLLLECENYADVHRKGGSGDMGVDIVAKWFDGNTSEIWLIQCKRWVNKVDATPIQRLISERERLGANKIACYTTSDYTKDAKKVARVQNVQLVNGKELLTRLNKYFPGKYYNSNL
ncbi:restriction endonuclease [Parvimonas micra]|uniref:Restriction endonuclease n=1 Tax=Parvimonas micra TaxID=33033 RepID=A0A9X3HD71_9FIRM|nr:restriction endonuclease [Parvimonas micra]MCZ7408221.1 restriction endonuclease [Parvimonas micra]MCZ7410148.1 restriction endonuclease [Parvimonas micra]MCZ7411977.1 restriction endonuclease [Parvimonas micra]WBB37056.1 restriction endonuclease [Parvimonas micra]